MKIFGLDTTRKSAKIFINDNETGLQRSFSMDENVKHSEGLFLYIEKALFECKMQISDFDVFTCIVGPGSFTGIRVGMATIKGFNALNHKKVIPINTFELIAPTCKNSVVLLNSTSTSCYYAKIKSKEIIETGVISKLDILNTFNDCELVVLQEEQNLINLEYNNIRIIDDVSTYYFQSLQELLSSNENKDFVPYYLQLSQAERNLKNE